MRYWIALGALAVLAFLYAAPTIEALRTPGLQAGTVALQMPNLRFPRFAIPKVHAAPRMPVIQPPAHTVAYPRSVPAHRVTHRVATRVPVVADSHTNVRTTPNAAAQQPKDPFANAPVVSDSTGIPAVSSTPVSATPAASPPPSSSGDPTYSFYSTSDTSTPTDTSTDSTVPVDSTTITPPSTPDTTSTTSSDPVSTTTPDDPSVTTSTSTSGGTSPAPSTDTTTGDTTTSTPTDPTSVTTPPATDPATSDPAATPGSGPSPPATWTLTLDPSATAVSVAVVGMNLVVTVDGVVTSKPLTDVSSLAISGGSALSVDLGGGSISIPVAYTAASSGSVAVGSGSGSTWTYDGHSGLQVAGGGVDLAVQNISSISAGGANDTLVGPGANTTWTISGADAGIVDSLSFTGVENLLGAANNEDTFVLQQSGSVSGTVDGGAAGFDTLVLDGTWSSVVSDPVDHSSGTLNLDGNVVTYAGLEPITNAIAVADFTLNLTPNAPDTVSLTSGGGMLTISGSTLETTTFAAPTHSLTINFGSQGDTLSIGDIHSVFTGPITVTGGAGNDTLAAPDVNGTWDITGIDGGTYTWTGGPLVTFTSVENLTGAATQNDAFTFETGGAVTGNIDAGGGTLTVGIASFVQVSGAYSFQQQSFTGAYAGSSSGTVTNGNVLTVSGTSGTGFVGVNAFSNPLGLQGTLTSFGLAVVTDGTHAWNLFQGTIANPQFVGLGLSFTAGLSNLTVQVNTGSGGTYLQTSGSPIVAGGVSLNFSAGIVAASTTFTIQVSSFVYFAGTFTIGASIGTTVDAQTGLDPVTIVTDAPGLSLALSHVSDCAAAAGSLALTTDDSMICNLPVNALQLSASNVSVFVGYSPGLTPTGAGGTLQLSDVQGHGVGLFATGVNVGLVLMSAFTTGNLVLDAFHPTFYSLRATAGNVAIVGIPGVTASATNIDVEVNGGGHWAFGSATVAADFADTFGLSGYTIATGGNPPITLHAAGALLSASADQILLSIGGFIYVDGSFSFSKGSVTTVDVSTGLSLTSAEEAVTFGLLPVSATNPGGGELAVTSDGSEIWNVPVEALLLGLGNVNVFVGYADDNLALNPATHKLDQTALDAANAVGLYLTGGNLGLTLMTADFPITVLTQAPLLYGSGMKFTALKSDGDSVGLVGVPDITLSATNFEVDVNEGSAGSLWPGTPVADFVSTFGPGGLLVPDDTSGDTVSLPFDGPIIGASADNVLLQLAGFVYISGSFAFSEGQEQWVDVASGISGAVAAAEFVGVNEYDTDPGGHTLGHNSDGSMIWNLPVSTINVGIGNASVFVGYSTGLHPTGPGHTLTLADVSNANGIGLLVSGVNLGLVLMKEDSKLVFQEAPLSLLTLTVANLRFFALTASAATAAIVGIPEVTATATGIQIRLNQGEAGSAWLGNLAAATPVVDFVASFGSGGLQVPLSTTGTATVGIPYTDEEIGASADQVRLQISQFVYLSGSFSFDKGPTLYVAVETGLTHDEAAANGLFLGIGTASSAPSDHSLAITSDGSELWNVPVGSIEIGIASGNIFAGYANGNIPLDSNGNISQAGLESQGSVGLFMSNVAVGLAMLRAPPLASALTSTSAAALAVSLAQFNFFTLKADAGNVALVGIPDLTLSSTNLEVRVNQG
ncbi:MAG TPA: hypothetical protein VGH92_13225, partial [Gaiellaceae bacterium]